MFFLRNTPASNTQSIRVDAVTYTLSPSYPDRRATTREFRATVFALVQSQRRAGLPKMVRLNRGGGESGTQHGKGEEHPV